jgi:four helix bundle protein
MLVHNYEKLIVWQKSVDLVENIYQLTSIFPKEEIYGITSQMRRSAVSIPSNIAEGARRNSQKEFHQFLNIAFASGAELETQIKITKRLKFTDELKFMKSEELLEEVMKMLNKLIQSKK